MRGGGLCEVVLRHGDAVPVSSPTPSLSTSSGAHRCGTTDIVAPVVVQETFTEVVCWIIKPVEDQDRKDPETKF